MSKGSCCWVNLEKVLGSRAIELGVITCLSDLSSYFFDHLFCFWPHTERPLVAIRVIRVCSVYNWFIDLRVIWPGNMECLFVVKEWPIRRQSFCCKLMLILLLLLGSQFVWGILIGFVLEEYELMWVCETHKDRETYYRTWKFLEEVLYEAVCWLLINNKE